MTPSGSALQKHLWGLTPTLLQGVWATLLLGERVKSHKEEDDFGEGTDRVSVSWLLGDTARLERRRK